MKLTSLIFLSLFLGSYSFAAKVTKVKANKVLIDLEGALVEVNQKIYVLNSSGKKIGLATITQVKNGKAIAIVNKGTPQGAEGVEIIENVISADPESMNANAGAKTSTKGIYRLNGVKIAGLLTLISNSMTTKQADGTMPIPNQENVALKGSSFGLSGSIDYPVVDWLTLRGLGGYEPFVAEGSAKFSSCDGATSRNCTANLIYLSAAGYVRFDIIKSKTMVWVAFGGATKFPLAKSTTALRADDVKMTFTIAAAAGIDYFINNKNYIPASLEYQLFPSSDTVSANSLMLRAGYGWSY
jgi:hypothetical protein